MPFDLARYYPPNNSKRRRAWEAHYRAKGCSATKAAIVARRKCERASTWPPVGAAHG